MSLEGMSDDQIKHLAELSKSLSEDPATRRSFQRLIKQKRPETVFPELEVEDAILKATEETKKQNDELRAELQKRDIMSTRRSLEGKIASDYPGLKFEDVEKAMVDHGIANHETAAKFLANERLLAEPAPEVPGRGGPMLMPSEVKQFFKNPTQTARKLASDAVNDIMRARARRAA